MLTRWLRSEKIINNAKRTSQPLYRHSHHVTPPPKKIIYLFFLPFFFITRQENTMSANTSPSRSVLTCQIEAAIAAVTAACIVEVRFPNTASPLFQKTRRGVPEGGAHICSLERQPKVNRPIIWIHCHHAPQKDITQHNDNTSS